MDSLEKLQRDLGEFTARALQKALQELGHLAVSGGHLAKRLALSLEQEWPEAIAWVVVASGPAWLLHLLVVRRPRCSAAGVLAWSGWLGLQVYAKGPTVLEATRDRGIAAVQATREVVQKSVVMVQAWIVVFLPFVSDVWRHASSTWRLLSFRARVALVGGPVTIFLLAMAYRRVARAFRERRAAMERVVKAVAFHGSFALVCYPLWRMAGFLSPNWLYFTLRHLLSTVPVLASLAALGWRPDCGLAFSFRHQLALEAPQLALEQPNGHRTGRRNSRRSAAAAASAPAEAAPLAPAADAATAPASPDMQRLWLSYWATWPALVALEQGLPWLVELLDLPEVAETQLKLRRGGVVLLLWLQVWQGSHLHLAFLRWLVSRLRVLEVLMQLLGQRGLQLLQLLRGGVPAPGAANLWAMWQFSRRSWVLIAAGGLAGLLSLLCVVVAFSRALSFFTRGLMVSLWVFAAFDAAETLEHGGDAMLARKLAFWPAALLWTTFTSLMSDVPVVGSLLRLLDPMVFALLMVASETILRRVVQPLLDLGTRLSARLLLVFTWRAFRVTRALAPAALTRRLTGAARQPLALPGPERSPAPAASPAASPAAAAAAAAAAPATPGPAPATSPNMGSRRSSHASVAASAASSNGANRAAASAAPVTPMTTTPRGSVATPSPEVRRRKKKGR
ncbi:unnamed protein product [Effrenium voratum]|uniref:Uncharacterized protein n=1 Tax=Effrenium voratum TaxID=2562239 RepID=A0AA36IXR4_9DINO|nr:unnamed protein product [Effrenium voratum]CAJ1418674.1 unnamed protein product [Effrenium voratum]